MLKPSELRKRLSATYDGLEKANEKSLMKAAISLREIEDSLFNEASAVIPVGFVSAARSALGVGRISDAQTQVAAAIRIIDEGGKKVK